MIPSTQEVIDYIKSNINTDYFFKVITTVNNDAGLDTPTNRFDKGVLIEKTLASTINGVIHENKVGYDVSAIINSKKVKFEVKSQHSLVYTRKGIKKGIFRGNPPKTSLIKFKNSLGKTHVEVPIICDYLLLVDNFSLSLVEKKVIRKYLKIVGDGATAQIPLDNINIIATNEKNPKSKTTDSVSYSNIKDKMMGEFISKIIEAN